MNDGKWSALDESLIGGEVSPNAIPNKLLIEWQRKTYAHPTLFIDAGMAVFFCFPCAFYMYNSYFSEVNRVKDSFLEPGVLGMGMIFFFWAVIVRQKTLYTYLITDEGGKVDYFLYFPKLAGFIFKSIAIFAFVALLAMISVMPSMMFAIVGVGGVGIVAAVKLWGWENEIDHDYFEWHRIQLVFTDRKRNLVVLQRRYDPEISFEENYMYFEVFLPKGKVDEFLDICKKYAPPHVDYEEGRLKY